MSKCCSSIKTALQGDNGYYEAKSAVTENGKTFRLNINTHDQVCKIKLDKGCIPNREGQKQCDYLILKCPPNSNTVAKFIFVELKGSGENANDGFHQIIGAIEYLRSKGVVILKEKIYGVIVGGTDTQKMNRLKEDFKRLHGYSLIHKTGSLYESN